MTPDSTPRSPGSYSSDAVAIAAAPEALFASILDIAADAIIVASSSQHILHFNQGASQIFGYLPEEVVGRPLTELLPDRYRGAHDAHVEAFGRGPERARKMSDRREVYGRRKDGVEFPAEASISRLESPIGMVYSVVLRDITERTMRTRNERFLSDASARVGTSLELTPTLQSLVTVPVPYLAEACIVDLAGDDDTWLRAVSTSDDPSVQAALEAIGHDELTWDSPWRAIDVLRSGKAEIVPVVTDEWLEAHTDSAAALGRLKALHIHSVLFVPLIARERPLGAMTFLRLADAQYTPAQLALAQALGTRAAYALDNARLYALAQRATRAREDVLSVVSHDLGNPLAAIRLCAAALLESPPSQAEEQRNLLQAIGNSADWMTRLIQDLLDVSTIEVGRMSIERRTETLVPILGQVLAMFKPQADEHGVSLTVQSDADVAPVHGDAARLVQALANLVGNSLKFTERGGAVAVHVSMRDDEVFVTVKDSGSGIPADQLPHIFKRYYTRRRGANKSGSGLGLSIARGIVEAHGGRIWAESTVGKGTTFFISLPASSGV